MVEKVFFFKDKQKKKANTKPLLLLSTNETFIYPCWCLKNHYSGYELYSAKQVNGKFR